MESEKKAFFSLSTCTFKISVSAYYNTPQSKNIEKKIHDKLLDLIIRISFIRIIEIKQILFYSSTKRKFSVHCFKLYTLKKKLYKKNINKLYKKILMIWLTSILKPPKDPWNRLCYIVKLYEHNKAYVNNILCQEKFLLKTFMSIKLL